MTRRKFVPRAYQHMIIDAIVEHQRFAVWAGMGTGKTVSTLTAIAAIQLAEEGAVLVCAPLRVAQSTWPDEALKWEHLAGLEVTPIVGTQTERRNALLDAYRTRSGVYTINYENIPWLIDEARLMGKALPFTMIVADESTKLKGFRGTEQVSKSGKEFVRKGGSERASALAKLTFKSGMRFVELTGTPSPNGLQDLWGQVWFLDKGRRLGRSFSAFTQRWFRAGYTGYGVEPLPHAQAEIQEAVRDICITIDAKDWFDLKDPIVNTIYVDLPPPARKLYQRMEQEMFMEIANAPPVEAANAADRTMKCLQLANGAVYVGEDDDRRWEHVHDVKIQALQEVVEEAAGMPVLVAYHFKSDLERLLKAFPKVGRHLDQDPQTIRDWNAGKIRVLFAHPASAGHGLSLQDGGNILVFFGHNWNLEEFQQMIERIGPTRQMQAGHDRPVFIHPIVARDTVDEVVMQRRESKRAVQDLLLDYMKVKGEPQ
jgi:SNF2 family DNA or RNA helicase